MSAPGDSVWIKNPDSKSSDSFLLGVVDESEGDSRQVKLKGSSVQHKLRKEDLFLAIVCDSWIEYCVCWLSF